MGAVTGGTIALYIWIGYWWIGHWSLLFLGRAPAAGIVLRMVICRRQGFHPIQATPRRYYAFRGWTWPTESQPIG